MEKLTNEDYASDFILMYLDHGLNDLSTSVKFTLLKNNAHICYVYDSLFYLGLLSKKIQ